MKIAMIIEAWKPIWWWWQAVANNLAKYLSEKQNCKVDLYVMNIAWKNKNFVEKINPNFNIIYTWKKRNFWLLSRICFLFEIVQLIKSNHKIERYNNVFAHANLPWIPAKILSKKLWIPCIYQVHWSWIEAMKKMYWDNMKSKIFFFIEDFIQTKIKYDLELSVDKLFLSRKNVNTPIFIPNWVDLEVFKNNDNIKKENTKWLNFIFVWRLHPQKGLIYLIKAANLIKNKLKNTKFIIIWEWEEQSYLQNEIEKLWIWDFFDFRWKKSWTDLINEYYKADIFILPSLFEWFPLTLLEAWACKLPVLATKVWENSNVITNLTNWWICEAWDYKILAKSIEEILKLDKNKLISIWENWFKLVENKYDLNNINKEIFYKIKDI